jgi:hypothetical protein
MALAVSCVLLRKGFHRSSLLDRQIVPALEKFVERQVRHVLDLDPFHLGVPLDELDISYDSTRLDHLEGLGRHRGDVPRDLHAIS